MDALTNAALESLVKEILPKLASKLWALAKVRAEARKSDQDLAHLTTEAQELLGLMSAWIQDGETGAAAPHSDSDLIEDDAMALLAKEGVTDIPNVNISGGKSIADSLSNDRSDDDIGAPSDEALSDEEAMAMLAGMEAKPTSAAPPREDLSDDATSAMLVGTEAKKAPTSPSDDELSDEATMAMLAGTEAKKTLTSPSDDELSDEATMAMLAELETKPPLAAPAGGEMSDAEARALLEAMDAPLPPPPAPARPTDGEMSDAEARALLEAMDAPAPVAKAPKAPLPAPSSADDEALALLKLMGGDDGSAEAELQASKSPVPAAVVAPVDNEDEESGEELVEIEEFAKNDFASDPDMMNDFLTNTNDLIETLDQTILQLEQNPTDKETIESIFRAAHTFKGAAGMFGFKAIERVMHRMENLFDLVRKGTLVPNADTIDVVFQGIDVLKSLLGGVRAGKPTGIKTVPIVRCLELAAKGKYVKRRSGANTPAPSSAAPAADESLGATAKPGAELAKKGPSAEQSTIRVDLERLDMLVNLVGELVIDRTRFASIEEDIRTSHPQLKVAGNMSETVQLFGRHMNEIHEIIMKIRMVPIGNAFNKFTRIVRDISRQLDKEIELVVDGEDTELDKTLVEQIGDPLIHLIRNSCDHGVEMPDVRAAAGKSRSGRIFLSARQEGNHIVISIEDDGKGIPVDAIRKKAIERGLISEETTLSKRDIFNLIFEPGFSTAEKVTTISGRGVGMDVVRKQISKLKGSIDIDSEPGKGTTTTIRLPLTLAIVQSLLVESSGEVFAIPLSAVAESVRIRRDEIQKVGDTEVIKRHDKVLPLMHLVDTLDLGKKGEMSWYSGYSHEDESESETNAAAAQVARRKDRLYVVIVGNGDHRFGIVVDQLLNQQEMVIKTMGPIMKSVPCVAGGAVLGNGEVVLVLDLQELEDRFRTRVRGKAA